ncbi:glycosyltransferase family 9 protein [Mucilaginibacter pallidiroseus]|uniref:Glycosyltransferase family 9 protein n=1 Tax=Mucilaginibacter pallidiroseus TaxID=2599295 RepID=A0A563UJS6_9SPHI|nr:glycosyltransferase family 9 protein [Mucilaginibacter pallidiroseus]TWR31538.1 glycosyltransferase family 9 protein [Mucilaginibacter pallidiroseus]
MSWKDCKNILCIRPDNMGDLIMTGPAIRALRQSFGAKVTVLTSSMAKGVIRLMPEIDDHIIYDLPWVKSKESPDAESINRVVEEIKLREFDAAIIFTVYSQNPLPTAMLVFMAGIPKVLAYCRENPYGLLTDWVPDIEPYSLIKHQVRRDLDLVAAVGATTTEEDLQLQVDEDLWPNVEATLVSNGVDINKPWLILHAGVSEEKREYPKEKWVDVAKLTVEKGFQVLFTGSQSESELAKGLAAKAGVDCFSVAGCFDVAQFACLIKQAALVVCVNTGTLHIAAAVGTPVVALYAQTNPQHTPWNIPNRVFEFSVPPALRSRNEIIAYVNGKLYQELIPPPRPEGVVNAISDLLNLPG